MKKSPCQKKVLSFQEAVVASKKFRQEGDKVVVTTGVYDIIHFGHILYLEDCAAHGDILIVGVAGDEIVRKSKGDCRPITTQEERALILASMECVTAVFISNDLLNEVCSLNPHCWMISLTSNLEHNKSKKEWASKFGIEVIEKDSFCDVHTTDVIRKIKDLPDN